MSVNKVILLGNIGNDPEVKEIGENKVCNFSSATNKVFVNRNGEKITQTDWHRIVCWGKLADIMQKYVKKGNRIFVEGEIRYRSYEDNKGEKKFITEIFANVIQLIEKKETNDNDFANNNDGAIIETRQENTTVEDNQPLPF